jgi:pimeloyl-ACP methyl ester carboxylesterase
MKIPPPARLIDIGGRRLHVDVRGKGSPAVVLEAGIAASSLSWCLVQNRIAEFTTAISYDRAGFGWSDPPPHRCTAADAARDLSLLLDRLEIDGPVVLAGHSFGGLIARVFEQSYPARAAGLILVDPVSRSEWRDPDEKRKRMLAHGIALSRRGAALAQLGVVGFALKLLLSGSRTIPKLLAKASAGRGASVTERLTGEVRKMPRELWPAIAGHWSEARCFRAMGDSLEQLSESAGQIDESRQLGDLPLTVLSAATASAPVLEEHEHDARLSTRGEHLIIAGSGHWLQLDAPGAVADAIGRVVGSASRA